jgi:hypothetical protein
MFARVAFLLSRHPWTKREAQVDHDDNRYLPHRDKASQLGVSTKTIDRWTATGLLEPARRINGRKYHRLKAMPKADTSTGSRAERETVIGK